MTQFYLVVFSIPSAKQS